MALSTNPYFQLEAAGSTFDLEDWTTEGHLVVYTGVESATTVATLNTITKSNPINGEFYFVYYDPTDITWDSKALLEIFDYVLGDDERAVSQIIFAQYWGSSWKVFLLTPQNIDEIVSTEMLRDLAVTADKIKKGTITSSEMANLSIGTAQLIAAAVTEAKLATGAVTTAKLANGAATADKLAANAVTTAKINNGAVTTDKLGASAVTTDKLDDGAVTLSKLANAAKQAFFNCVIPIEAADQYVTITTLPASGSILSLGYNIVVDIAATDDLTLTFEKVTSGGGTITSLGSDTITASTSADDAVTDVIVAAAPDNQFIATNFLRVRTQKTTPGGMIAISIKIQYD